MDLPDLRHLLVNIGDIYRYHDGQLIEVDVVYDDGVACDFISSPDGPRLGGYVNLSFDDLARLERLVLSEWTTDVVN